MILSSDSRENKFQLNVNDSIISSDDSVTLLKIEIEGKVNFKSQIMYQ